jgi:hypothetical protein
MQKMPYIEEFKNEQHPFFSSSGTVSSLTGQNAEN